MATGDEYVWDPNTYFNDILYPELNTNYGDPTNNDMYYMNNLSYTPITDWLTGWTGEPTTPNVNDDPSTWFNPDPDLQTGNYITGPGPTLTNADLLEAGITFDNLGTMTLPGGYQIKEDGSVFDPETSTWGSAWDSVIGAVTSLGSKLLSGLNTKVGSGNQTIGSMLSQYLIPAAGGAATANAQADLYRQQQDQNQRNMEPWLVAGASALNKLGTWDQTNPMPDLTMPTAPTFDNTKYDPNNYFNSPVYNALMKSGTDALNARGAASGSLGSGNQAAALQSLGMQTGANYMTNDYNMFTGQQTADNQNRQTGFVNQSNNVLNEYNADVNKNTTGYNRLAGVANTGQVASNNLASLGNQSTGQIAPLVGNVGANLTGGAAGIVNTLFK